MKKIATLSILFTTSFFVLTYGKPNTAQGCPSTTLSTRAEVDAFACSEVHGEQTISPHDITNLNSLTPSRVLADRYMIQDYPELLNIDWLRISNQLVGAYQLPATINYRYESYHPLKEELF